MISYPLILPHSEICAENELYFRGGRNLNNICMEIARGKTMSANTFYNSFPLKQVSSKTPEYLEIDIAGDCDIALYVLSRLQHPERVAREKYTAPSRRKIKINIPQTALKDMQLLYFTITALQENVIFFGGAYYLQQNTYSEIKISAVICTYKREETVCKNVNNILNFLDYSQLPLDVYVIDNGNTLQSMLPNHRAFHYIQNRNFGGSGGFTRGILESIQSPAKYTHVLLMDDDISFHPEILARTYCVLCMQDDMNAIIGAPMLDSAKQYMQYTKGETWEGRCGRLIGHNRDMRNLKNIIDNPKDARAEYSGWWYCCIPLCKIEDHGLPLPVFFKGDDVEYALRLKSPIMFVSGIAVWHESFSEKYVAYLEYYQKRNELIINAIHRPNYALRQNLYKIQLSMIKQMVRHRPDAAFFILQGCLDFLKGPSFLLTINEEALHKKLIALAKEKAKNNDTKITLKKILLTPFCSSTKTIFKYYKEIEKAMKRDYAQAAATYRSRYKKLTTQEFWHMRFQRISF